MSPPDASFSPREKEVAALLLQGKSNQQIALALGITARTAEFHLTHIYARLGVASRAEAILALSQRDLRESAGALAEAYIREAAAAGVLIFDLQ
jgi:DNA-binding CsgD family transcriptional regulator